MSKNKLLSLFFSLLCICMGGMAQNVPFTEKVEVYGMSGSSMVELGYQIIPTQDAHYVIAGSWQEKAMLAKVNECGDTLWLRTFQAGDYSQFFSVLERPDGGLLATGECLNCVPGENRYKAFSILADSNGAEIGRSVLGDSGVAFHARHLAPTSDGGYVGIGHTTSAPCAWTQGDIRVVKVDASYQVQWDHSLDMGSYDYAHRVIQTADGGYVVTGAVWESGQSQYHAVWRLNSAGTVVWDTAFYPYVGFCYSPAPNAVAQMANGNLAVTGGYRPDTTFAWEGFLLELRLSDGFSLDSLRIGNGVAQENDLFFDLQRRTGGNLVLAGQRGGWANFYQPWVLEYDPAFNLVADHRFQAPSQAGQARSLALIPGDSLQFVFCGRQEYIFNGSDLLVGSRIKSPGLLSFTGRPQHKQLYPRDLGTNKGTVRFQGTATASPNLSYTDLVLEIYRNDTFQAGLGYALNYTGNTAAFSVDYEIPAELAEYDFKLYGVGDGCQFLEAEANDLVAGDAYIVQGQSNALATFGGTLPGSEFIRVFGKRDANDTVYVWRKEANDPEPYADNRSGNLGLALAKRIVDTHGIPVAVINGATPGIAIQDMLPNSANRRDPTTNYGRLLLRMEKSGLKDDVRSIVFFQGEANAAPGPDNLDSTGYHSYFGQLNQAWGQDYPILNWKFLYQIRPGCLSPVGSGTLHIQEAQRRIPNLFIGWKVVSATAMDHDGCHFSAGGYDAGGDHLFVLMDGLFYPGSLNLPEMEAPNPFRIVWDPAAPDQLSVNLNPVGPPVFPHQWFPGNEADFRLEGDPTNSVVSGAFVNDILILQLAQPTQPGVGLSYTSHVGGDLTAVRNGWGVGMLAFWNHGLMVGLDESLDQLYGLDVFPNPGSGAVNIHSEHLPPGEVEVTLTDLPGRVLERYPLRSNGTGFRARLDIQSGAGVYLLKISHENGAVVTRKLILR